MSERILDEDDMGWIAIRVLSSLLRHRNELDLIPQNLQDITEDNAFITDLSFYTGAYQEKELVQFFKRLEEFNIPVAPSEEDMYEALDRQIENGQDEENDPSNLPF